MDRDQADDVASGSGERPGPDSVRGGQGGASVVPIVTGNAVVAARLADALGLAGADRQIVTARNGIEAIHLVAGLARVDLLVIDSALPGLTGAVVARAIRALQPQARVVMLVAQADDDAVVEALGAGADAISPRSAAPADFLRLVQQVRSGEPLARALLLERPGVAARVVALVQERTSAEAVGAPDLRGLTARELAVVDGVVQGMTNREIGARLHLNEQTVKNHMTSILRKMRLYDRLHVLRLATQEGWIRFGQDTADSSADGDASTLG